MVMDLQRLTMATWERTLSCGNIGCLFMLIFLVSKNLWIVSSQLDLLLAASNCVLWHSIKHGSCMLMPWLSNTWGLLWGGSGCWGGVPGTLCYVGLVAVMPANPAIKEWVTLLDMASCFDNGIPPRI